MSITQTIRDKKGGNGGNMPDRRDGWYDENGKFKGWPKGIPHQGRKVSPWGDLSGKNNRAKIQGWLNSLFDASYFTRNLNQMYFYRSLSEGVKRKVRDRLKRNDPKGLKLFIHINKAMTHAENRGKEFDLTKLLTEIDKARNSELKKQHIEPSVKRQERKNSDLEESYAGPSDYIDRKRNWGTYLWRKKPEPTPEEKEKERLQKILEPYM